ncbi:MAG: hypothetical protein HeimAB125_20690 [Candidatus Heimdallarchaeota archaeon AB_125]|nr:MAG: hypothetical protein HeimAB125_20690 [Candidatus Heimdallarchaeota archaeon AB_125]
MTKVNGLSIRYIDIPNEGKETIVLLPYGGGMIGMWNGVIPHFKKDYRILALDQRCHGFSDKPDECHIDDMAIDVAALMDILEENCLHPEIEEVTKDHLTVRIECPGSTDATFTINLSQWTFDEEWEVETTIEEVKKEEVKEAT